MIQAMKKRMKNEKGLTLIELLAVVVILAIIAAIAIPAIGGLIDNTKKDAHVANAQQMISSAKTWVAGNGNEIKEGGKKTLELKVMENEGLIDQMEDPDKIGYKATLSKVVIEKTEDKKYKYTVTLTNGKRGISGEQKDLKRARVQ